MEKGACDARDGNAEDDKLVLAAAASCGSAVILSSRHPWRHQSVRGSVRGGESEAIGGAAAVAAAGSAAQWREDRLEERRGEQKGENIRLVSRIAKRARHYFYFRKKRFRRRSGVFVPAPERSLPPRGPGRQATRSSFRTGNPTLAGFGGVEFSGPFPSRETPGPAIACRFLDGRGAFPRRATDSGRVGPRPPSESLAEFGRGGLGPERCRRGARRDAARAFSRLVTILLVGARCSSPRVPTPGPDVRRRANRPRQRRARPGRGCEASPARSGTANREADLRIYRPNCRGRASTR